MDVLRKLPQLIRNNRGGYFKTATLIKELTEAVAQPLVNVSINSDLAFKAFALPISVNPFRLPPLNFL